MVGVCSNVLCIDLEYDQDISVMFFVLYLENSLCRNPF